MSDTPRTDKVREKLRRDPFPYTKMEEHARTLELSLARKEALLRRWVERKKAEGGLLQDGLLEDTERELEGK